MGMTFIMRGILLALAILPLLSRAKAVNIVQLRQLAVRNNVTCVLVFGDSSVDPGNNNILPTTTKSNFLPYGKNFFHGSPTGRFSNGRLATDFIADALGYTKTLPAFLDPKLKSMALQHGVSFASAGSGFDDFTANISNVLPVSKQLQYFLHYKIHLRQLVGEQKADSIIQNAIFVVSMGSNDFLQNYFIDPTRPKQFTLEQYQNFLVSLMAQYVEVMHRQGARRLVVVGIPPLGCLPLVKTLMDQNDGCVENYNKAAYSFNSKVQVKLAQIRSILGMKTALVDVYGIMRDAITNPKKYGFTESSKGCCGTGTVEYGDSCKGMSTCTDPAEYVFWDAVHPTEHMYKIIAMEALESVETKIFY